MRARSRYQSRASLPGFTVDLMLRPSLDGSNDQASPEIRRSLSGGFANRAYFDPRRAAPACVQSRIACILLAPGTHAKGDAVHAKSHSVWSGILLRVPPEFVEATGVTA